MPVTVHRETSLAVLLAVGSGALVALQSRVNGRLAGELGAALPAALVSFAVGLVVVATVVGVRARRPATRAALGRLLDVPWWARLGGLGGAGLVASAAWAAPQVGVAALTVAIVAGQTAGGLLVDRVGLSPGGRRAVTGPRLAGALLGVAAVVVVARGDRDALPTTLTTSRLTLVVGLVALAGLGIAVQQALNGRARAVTGDALVATLLNFLVGTYVLGVATLVVALGPGLPDADWPTRPDLYVGGPLGVTFVAIAAVVVRRLGVLRLGLAVVAGQLAGAVVLDVAAPLGERGGLAAATVAGALLTVAGVVVSSVPARAPRVGAARLAQLVVGLLLFGVGIWLGLVADLGVGPWDVLAGGLARQTGWGFGLVAVLVSVVVLVVGLVAGVRPGLGTVLNVVLIGAAIEVLLRSGWLGGLADEDLLTRVLVMLGGILAVAVGSALYLGTHLGPGPRDGLMVALHTRTGWPVGAARAVLEVMVLAAGAALGGPVGPGTLAFALLIGPAVQVAFTVLRQTPAPPPVARAAT